MRSDRGGFVRRVVCVLVALFACGLVVPRVAEAATIAPTLTGTVSGAAKIKLAWSVPDADAARVATIERKLEGQSAFTAVATKSMPSTKGKYSEHPTKDA